MVGQKSQICPRVLSITQSPFAGCVPVSASTQGPSWGYSTVNFERFFRKRGRFSPNVDKIEEMAPRTRGGYPHEGPFVNVGSSNNLKDRQE